MSTSFESASGLRPAGAFVALGALLCVVAARGVQIALAHEGAQPASERTRVSERPAFELVDAAGVPLALTVESYRLELSPNACWQAHTPDRLAGEVADALEGTLTREELLERFLPDAVDGVITLDAPGELLDAEQAAALHRWIKTGELAHVSGELEGSGRPLRGLWVEPLAQAATPTTPGAEPEPARYVLRWQPRVALSAQTRVEQGFAEDAPTPWARRLADALAACTGEDWPRGVGPRAATDAERRERVWDALCPSRFKIALRGIQPRAANRLHALFERERVHPHQMQLERALERRYPVQGLAELRGDALAQAREGEDPPFEVLGRWGTYAPAAAERIARRELGLAPDAPPSAALRRRVDELVHDKSALDGLERLGARLLARPDLAELESEGESYRFVATQAVRQPVRKRFVEVQAASAVPRVLTTLRADLGQATRAVLEDVMDEHDPALAMAIVVDLESGDVLALDSLDAYGVSGLGPILHSYTPGSTFKVVTMAVALEAGKVRPDELFDTFDGHFVFQGRPIREAEGNPLGWITASKGLAESCNAVLTQIGLRVPAREFRDKLVELGYGRRPGTGLGPERPGYLCPLPWKERYTHASVCFGHELSTTLWQHATALAAILRGGVVKPLRLVRGVEQDGERRLLAEPEGRRVFSEHTCAEVRRMMELGAREGTGRNVSRADLAMGTKTGTSEKVGTEICLHVELAHEAEHHCGGACRAKLVGQRGHRRRSCYTSSMVAFGRLPEGGREVMVYVVVDEPRGKSKYGADVAGRAAVSLLAEALGRTHERAPLAAAPRDGFVDCPGPTESLSLRPWAEEVAR